MYLARNVDSEPRAASANRQLLLLYCCGGFGVSNYGGPWIDLGAMFIGNGRLIATDRIEGAIPRKPNRSSILWSGFLECDGAIHTYLPLARARFSEATSPPLVDSTRYWGGTPHSASRDSDACLCFDWGTEMELNEECLG